MVSNHNNYTGFVLLFIMFIIFIVIAWIHYGFYSNSSQGLLLLDESKLIINRFLQMSTVILQLKVYNFLKNSRASWKVNLFLLLNSNHNDCDDTELDQFKNCLDDSWVETNLIFYQPWLQTPRPPTVGWTPDVCGTLNREQFRSSHLIGWIQQNLLLEEGKPPCLQL